jgi:transposase
VIPLSFVAALLPPSLPLRLEQVEQQGLWLTLTVVSTQEARACPLCGHPSTNVHSRYQRTLVDLPVQGLRLRFCLGVRRFYCRVRECIRQVFCERLEGFARSSARQTQRLAVCLELIAQALGGNAGARLAERLSLPARATMLLRRLRLLTIPPAAQPRVVGIDDWAYKRGQRYGTILVDLEQHRVLDLLPDRTTETVAAWLRQHPKIEIVSRDRASAYADAVRQGAPQAEQVADRWHLLQNLTDAVQRVVERYHSRLREIVQTRTESVSEEQTGEGQQNVNSAPSQVSAEQRRRLREAERQARCAEVLRLHAQGFPILTIARQLRMHRRLVRQYLRAGVLPRAHPSGRKRQLDPYANYLSQRWQEGCHNAAQLWRELRERGFTGSDTRVRQWMRQYHRPDRKGIAVSSTIPQHIPSPRQITWIVLNGPRPADEKTRAWVQEFRQRVPEMEQAAQLANEFRVLLRDKRSDQLSDWLARAAQSPLASFAAGLRRDLAAVQAACSSPWSQGQVEGQVNRLKLLKRQMYGRASFPLLRSRIFGTEKRPQPLDLPAA